ncbi:MAG TPA: NAD/NADP octopine/nopaline dehydrogenase family protein [Lachnospiraceae bacterium]|nr:NAD/NADP octopine/nopaline dehydrogenase family protein [Bacillota bacterium]HOS28584.1 NAD/NADP octopine/nopaline dehydrogenase family protein [Deltaproteobacteria bacterium]HUM85278.1 NAD/NADP octopine/nopaline dehydrogenase family protein [Lachnospiraceae bacterium]
MSIYSVLGAGNGGQALSALLKRMGHEVHLWNRGSATINALNSLGAIELKGQCHVKAKLDLITTHLEDAVRDAEIIFIVIPANAHREIALRMGRFVGNKQAIILNPGRTGGVLEFIQGLTEAGSYSLPLVMETQSLLCACRAHAPGILDILSFKRENTISGIPRSRIEDLLPQLNSIYGNLKLANTTLETGLDNIGAILHPTPVLLNSGWIESRDVFFPHYYYGISRSVAALVEKIDSERLQVARKYGVAVSSVKQWHENNYGFKGRDLYETLQGNSAYASIDAPRTLTHRYLTEDIPTGLVPISELGRTAGVPTPHIDMMIELGNAMLNVDFRKNGRNLKRLGLEGKGIEEIRRSFA